MTRHRAERAGFSVLEIADHGGTAAAQRAAADAPPLPDGAVALLRAAGLRGAL